MPMTPELEAHLRSFVNFPSPPGVATHIIELAQDPNIEMGKVAKAVSLDPALTTKILRIANSPLYAQRRRSDNLRQALVVLGLNATLTLALSFSLVKSLRSDKPNGVNYPHFWRRAVLSATASRALGDALGQTHAEERFLAGLLQDIGMLALDRGVADLYRDLGEVQRDHRALQAHEKRRLAIDHAEVGAWLMRTWNLPDRLCVAIEQSHRIEQARAREPADIFNRCVSLSGSIADIFLLEPEQRPFAETAQVVERCLGLSKEEFGAVLNTMSSLIPDTEGLFEIDILGSREPDSIMEQAREILMVRNLQTLRQVEAVRDAGSAQSRRADADEEARRDALTGCYNRSHAHSCLAREFAHSLKNEWPLSVAFVDVDGMKQINERHGHPAGDRLLQAAARVLRGNTRETDIVARYEGEEFVLVLPATDQDTARTICERIVSAFRQARHDVGAATLSATVSIGHATNWSGLSFDNVEHLVKAAEQALYTAKLQGRDRALAYDASARNPQVHFL